MLRINAELLEAVEKWATDEFRSTNGQLEWIISKALKEAKRYKKNEETSGTAGEDEKPVNN